MICIALGMSAAIVLGDATSAFAAAEVGIARSSRICRVLLFQ